MLFGYSLGEEQRREILKELPKGELVTYMGSSDFLFMKKLKKIGGNNRKMFCVLNSKEYQLSYKNLVCESIIRHEKIVDALLNGDDKKRKEIRFFGGKVHTVIWSSDSSPEDMYNIEKSLRQKFGV